MSGSSSSDLKPKAQRRQFAVWPILAYVDYYIGLARKRHYVNFPFALFNGDGTVEFYRAQIARCPRESTNK